MQLITSVPFFIFNGPDTAEQVFVEIAKLFAHEIIVVESRRISKRCFYS